MTAVVNPIWRWTKPGEQAVVTVAGQNSNWKSRATRLLATEYQQDVFAPIDLKKK